MYFEWEAKCEICSGRGCPDCDDKGEVQACVGNLDELAANLHRLPISEYPDAIAWAYAAYTGEGEEKAWIDGQPVIQKMKQRLAEVISRGVRKAA